MTSRRVGLWPCGGLAVALQAVASGSLAAAELRCPETIEVSSTVRSTHAGWQGFVRPDGYVERYPLRGVAFTDGHPADRGFLRSTSSREDRTRGERTDVYVFSGARPEGIWLVCQYRETREALFRPIDAAVCEVISTSRPDRPVAAIACR